MEKHVFYQNGLIVQRVKKWPHNYLGVEGDNWFLDEYSFPKYKEEIKNVYEEYRKTICDNSIEGHKIECCNDLNFLNDYIDLCKKIHTDINVILCESLISEPKLKVDKKTCQFLGYDYAYKGGSFYSGVLNDLCFERMIEMKDITLNQFGLCATMDELNSYIQKRNELKLIMPQYTFEDGDFTVYKLWKLDFNSIL